jgi:Zn-dependent protease with chaperone function
MNDGVVRAVYHDGLSSRPREAALVFLPQGRLRLEVEGLAPEEFARGEATLESRLGAAPRFLRLPGDRRCEIRDHEALDGALRDWAGGAAADGAARWLHRVEQSWRLVVVAAAAMVGIAWLTIAHGVPWAARQAAQMLPPAVTHRLADETMATFDRILFEPTRLPVERREALTHAFARMMARAGEPTEYRVEFRASPRTGPNAFALPSGLIVMTDELVELAEHDDEILAVLAHEAGHVRHRHILRSVLQNAAVAVVVTLVTGDVSSTTAAAAGAPAFLLQSRFSREFEREADVAAVQTLQAAGIDPENLARMLERLAADGELRAESPGGETEAKGGVMDYIGTHPPTKERVRRIREAGEEP